MAPPHDETDLAPPPPPVAHVRPKTFRDFIWDSDTHLKSPEERKLIWKMDILILIPICLSWLMKYIDQSNLANAYVSGLKEDLNIKANEYTYMQVLYNIAVCICTIPGSMAITRIRPSHFLAGCEIGWAVFTFAQAGAHSVKQMYAFRFLVGVFESPFQTSAVFVIASWYTPSELAKRVSLYFLFGPCGSTLNGKLGLAGWRWLYIVCGCMTVPVGIGLLIFLPDYPSNCRSRFITLEERELAKSRCAKAGVRAATGKMDLAFFKKVFTSWRWPTLVFVYLIYALGVQDPNYYGVWLKAKGFSVTDRNILSAGMYLFALPSVMLWGWLSDLTGSRLWLCVIPLCIANIPLGIIATSAGTTTKSGILMVEMAFLFCEVVLITHIFYSWIGEICRDDAQERAFIMGWIFIILCIPGFFFIDYMHKRQLRQEAAAGAIKYSEESAMESDDKIAEKVEA
ncbi:hypothetical protein MNV49_005317 [Pseudohyphozyma bogoriensis]|nr:hypothetical protein MNV49_005317 [Pseudohyphozyma bogoriensis]